MAARKSSPSKPARLLRLVLAVLDPRAWAHLFRMVNHWNHTHVAPLRRIRRGPGAAISPDAAFANPERISLGARARIGARATLWAGPGAGRIVIGDDALFGPDVLVTAAGYRFNDGGPVTDQLMDEADVVIGDDVWIGAKAVLLPGARVGDGAVVAAGAVVRGAVPAFAVVAGVPAKVVGQRRRGGPC
jgi:acetyltransferase-like isoleucine patch superfamily enzyme